MGQISHWNFRIVKQTQPNGYVSYHIHEIYYNTDGSIWLWNDKPESPYGEDLEDLNKSMELLFKALSAPVINYEDLPKPDSVKVEPLSDEEEAELIEEINLKRMEE
jgi:inorganic pyrophosphatase